MTAAGFPRTARISRHKGHPSRRMPDTDARNNRAKCPSS